MWLRATNCVYWSPPGEHTTLRSGHELLVQQVLYKHLIMREEHHYSLHNETKVVISFPTAKQSLKKLQCKNTNKQKKRASHCLFSPPIRESEHCLMMFGVQRFPQRGLWAVKMDKEDSFGISSYTPLMAKGVLEDGTSSSCWAGTSLLPPTEKH